MGLPHLGQEGAPGMGPEAWGLGSGEGFMEV